MSSFFSWDSCSCLRLKQKYWHGDEEKVFLAVVVKLLGRCGERGEKKLIMFHGWRFSHRSTIGIPNETTETLSFSQNSPFFSSLAPVSLSSLSFLELTAGRLDSSSKIPPNQSWVKNFPRKARKAKTSVKPVTLVGGGVKKRNLFSNKFTSDSLHWSWGSEMGKRLAAEGEKAVR